MAGALLIVLVMLLVGPILVFAGGAAWSALLGGSFDAHAAGDADGGEPTPAG